MAKVFPNPKNENIIQVGDDVRIEAGPKMVTEVATPELLNNSRTADHYQEGSRDSYGRPIVLGQPMTFLEWGGSETEQKTVFYVYHKVPVNSVDEFINNEPNPNFVPPHVRDANEGDNVVAYDYKWEEVGVRATYDAALDLAQRTAGE